MTDVAASGDEYAVERGLLVNKSVEFVASEVAGPGGPPTRFSLADVRRIAESIVLHEGHDDINVCVEDIITSAKTILFMLDRIEADYDALLDDALTLMDQHASEEVQMEARRRIIERHAEAKP